MLVYFYLFYFTKNALFNDNPKLFYTFIRFNKTLRFICSVHCLRASVIFCFNKSPCHFHTAGFSMISAEAMQASGLSHTYLL